MSDTSQGPGWWQASDGRWYRPEQHPNYADAPPSTTALAASPNPDQYPYPQAGPKQTNGLAIASLVLSILWLWGVGALLAVIFGIRARRQIRESGGMQGGDGLAIAGLVIGIVGLVGTVLVTALVFAAGFSNVLSFLPKAFQVTSCNADAKSLETALQAYHARNGSYPSVPDPWSAANYESNFAPLETAASAGGPLLERTPNSSHYIIEYDSSGHVWVEGPGTYDATYNATQDYGSNPNACSVATPG
jgi:hypothetical protein